MDFQVERWATYARDAEALWPLHWKEVALTQDAVPLDMDTERYAALDEAGILHIVTGRDQGRLVAYFTALVLGHLHYKSTLHALTDLYYISPLWRRGTHRLAPLWHGAPQPEGPWRGESAVGHASCIVAWT